MAADDKAGPGGPNRLSAERKGAMFDGKKAGA
jgi:hypothetical protein